MPPRSRYNSKFEADSSMAAANVVLAGQGLGMQPSQYDATTGVPKNPKAKPKPKDRYSGT
jgi:hypothetical protein